jgi:CheY-specific phosphatase CheX
MAESEFLQRVETEISLAASGVFRTLLAEEVEIRRNLNLFSDAAFDYCATIQFADASGRGLLRLGFTSATLLRVTNALLGETAEAISDSNRDAVAEILNMLYGSARARLNAAGHEFIPAIPTLERAPGSLLDQDWPRSLSLELCTSHGSFSLLIATRVRERSAA